MGSSTFCHQVVVEAFNPYTMYFLSPQPSGTPRQDVPPRVYCDAAMFDDVFDKKGKLLTSRNTPKISSPLHTLEYNRYDMRCTVDI